MLLGVNVDHVATLRQARGTRYPDPVAAALLAMKSGADSITVHLREDRRHIQDYDIERLTELSDLRVNLEMAVTDEMIAIACQLRPSDVCMVPEKRAELTTEGGLDVVSQCAAIASACSRLNDAGIRVSLFVDPENDQIEAARHCGAAAVELHTGTYADAESDREQQRELERIQLAAASAAARQLVVNAGHGLHLDNVQPIAAIGEIVELNIGHALISQAIFDGLPAVVAEMKRRMLAVRTVS